MKYTGIERIVDDIGRIAIPKDIRRNLKIREGDALEFWVDGENICLRKHEVRLTPAQKYVLDTWNAEHPYMPITEERFLGGE